jgi:hypothetical protein
MDSYSAFVVMVFTLCIAAKFAVWYDSVTISCIYFFRSGSLRGIFNMKVLRIAAVVLCFDLIVLSGHSQTLAITHARLIDGTGAAVKDDAASFWMGHG